jgi:hypothetical protein
MCRADCLLERAFRRRGAPKEAVQSPYPTPAPIAATTNVTSTSRPDMKRTSGKAAPSAPPMATHICHAYLSIVGTCASQDPLLVRTRGTAGR